MRRDGLENVRLDPVKVPHWVRGAESLEIVAPGRHPLVMLGLGNSVGTPADGVLGDLLVVHSFQELDAAADRVKGRIVLFNVPFTTYDETVAYRGDGPSRAAARGAVAALVRAVGPAGLRTPHTGALRYADDQPASHRCGVGGDADRRRMRSRHRVRLRLRMKRSFFSDADSFNVICELAGREKPENRGVSGHFGWGTSHRLHRRRRRCLVRWDALLL